jgi:D-glycero-D-manno-heptose 1,7-bisphosphate phosphatase
LQDSGALLLDRDGVINRRRSGHVKSWAEFDFLPGVLPALRELERRRVRVVVITNQSVVGRGLITAAALDAIHLRMVDEVASAGGRIEAVLACLHHPEDGCACRKPGTGLFERASRDLGVSIPDSVMIGDSLTDVEAALAAGCKRAILVGVEPLGHLPEAIRLLGLAEPGVAAC